MHLRTHSLREAIQTLANAAIESAALDARLLLLHALDISHEALIRDGDALMSAGQAEAFEALVTRRAAHEPMAYILGYRDFWKDRFEVNAHTLIPRPDSESLIEAVLEVAGERAGEPLNILDICTGSGCLLVSLLREFSHANGVGCDISHGALEAAKRNAAAAGMAERAQFICGDMIKSLAMRADIIVSNPPYISRNDVDALEKQVREYEPRAALEGGNDGLNFYRQLAENAPKLLNKHGIIALEVGHDQADAVSALMQKDCELITQKHDLGGHVRALVFGRSESLAVSR